MKVSASLPTGVAGLFFDSARRRRALEERLVSRLEGHGFDEVILPVVDYLDPYEELLSEGSREELYRFVDRDGAVLALRADFTPMLARLIAPRLAALPKPLRLFYRGDVMRYQGERVGRPRELYQLGAEVLGAAGDEVEEIAVRRFLELLAESGREVTVVLGFAGALDAPVLAFSKSAALSPAGVMHAVVRRERSMLRPWQTLLEVVEDGTPAAAADLDLDPDDAPWRDDPDAEELRTSPPASERLERLRALRAELGTGLPATVSLEIDLAEFADQPLHSSLRDHLGARAYYDGLVFRAFDRHSALPVGGGGRYDRLFEKLGADTTAAGFCVSVDELAGDGETGDGG